MFLLTELIVTLGSMLILTVSSLLWKLAAHRGRFRDLVCSCARFLLISLVIANQAYLALSLS
jgi:hypothetical protein